MSLLGLDIFAGNSATKVTAAVKRPDMVFTIAKATEGRTFNDARHDAIRDEVLGLGDVFGSYHFGFLSNNGVEDAKHFLDRAQPRVGQLIGGDFENWDQKNNYAAMANCSWEQRWKYALDWTVTVIDEAKTLPLQYVNWNYLREFRKVAHVSDWEWWIQCPLWLAQWQTNGVQTLPGQFDYAAPHADGTVEWHPTFHQYISGTTSASGLDENWFVGSAVDLSKFVIQEESAVDLTPLVEKLDLLVTGQTKIVDGLNTLITSQSVNIEALDYIKTRFNNLEEGSTAFREEVGRLLSTQTDTMATEVGARVATATSQAVVESVDDALGGFKVTAEFTRKDAL